MALVYANLTGQVGTFRTGTPHRVDLTATRLQGFATFAESAAAGGWNDGDTLGVLLRLDDDNRQVWTGVYRTAGRIELDTLETSIGTLSDGATVDVLLTLTEATLPSGGGDVLTPAALGAPDLAQAGLIQVTQVGHGFTLIGTPVYTADGSTWAAAAADDADTIHTGVIASIDGDDLVIQQSGVLSGITFATLTPGQFYFLADDGSLSLTEGTISAPVLQALTSSSALILPYRASGEAEIQAANITDATATGRSLITATDAAAARLVAQAEYASLNGHNVLEYGVVADFATTKTDNRAALQALINLVESAGRGVVYFPPGRYFADVNAAGGASLDVGTANIVFLGAHMDVSVIHFEEGTNALFTEMDNVPKGSLSFARLGITGTFAVGNEMDEEPAIQTQWFPEVSVVECAFRNIGGMAVNVNLGNSCFMHGNVVDTTARDGLRSRHYANVRITNNYITGCGDDPITAHVQAGNIPSLRPIGGAVIANNTLLLNGGAIKVTSGSAITITDNVIRANNEWGVFVRAESAPLLEGTCQHLDVNISNNTVLDTFKRWTSTYEPSEAAIKITLTTPQGAASTNGTAPGFYDSTSGVFILPWDHYWKSTNDAANPVGRDERIRVFGNIIGRTLPAGGLVSAWGYGTPNFMGTFVDATVTDTHMRHERGIYIAEGPGVINLEISNNTVTHCTTGIEFPAQTTDLDSESITIKNNTFRDCLGKGISGSGSVKFPALIYDNQFDLDPYRLSENSNINGTYDADGLPRGIDLGSLVGPRIEQNIFRNCCKAVLNPNSYFLDNNVQYCDPVGFGFSVNNAGIGGVLINNGWVLVIEDCDPTSATFGQQTGTMVKEASAMPTSGPYYRGWFVRNTTPTSSGILGWVRLTTSFAHVLGTDWAAINVN